MRIFWDERYPKVALNMYSILYTMYAWGQSTGLVTENLMKVNSTSPKRRNISIYSMAESLYSCGFPTISVFALDPFKVPFLLYATVGHAKFLM